MKNKAAKRTSEQTERLTPLKNAMDAFRNAPVLRNVSAMEVVVSYVAIVGRVEHFKRGEEHVFRTTQRLGDGGTEERWSERHLNAYAIRDEFLKVKDWSAALEFLETTGVFSPLGDTLTWSEFKRWQEFVYLVQEHSRLAATMQSGNWSGDTGEVLKALTGDYPSSFFDLPLQPESPLEAKWKATPRIHEMIQEGIAHQEQKRRETWAWFREPPEKACSIQWIPKTLEDQKAVWPKLQRGGAMIEFLLPQNALKPLLLIKPSYTIQAIASAIYGDRIHREEYRSCEGCKALFKLGAHKDKKFCNREQCKNAAHQRNRRANARKKKSSVTEKTKTKKARAK
jgi:hypothetical protein